MTTPLIPEEETRFKMLLIILTLDKMTRRVNYEQSKISEYERELERWI